MAKNQYPNLTAPLAVRGHLLKTRFSYPVAQPHFLQGNELYPAGQTISYYENRVRGKGAAIIFLQDLTDMTQRDMPLDCGHFSMYDLDDKGCQNGISHFLSIMHAYGALVTPEVNMGRRMGLSCNKPEWITTPGITPPMAQSPDDYFDKEGNPVPLSLDFAKSTQQGFDKPLAYEEGSDSSEKLDKGPGPGPGGPPGGPGGRVRYMTREIMDEYIEKTIEHAKKWQNLGADGGLLDLCHNFPIGQFLRRGFNKRTDEYGGSLENCMRFPLEVIRKLREAMGPKWVMVINNPVVVDQSGEDGMTLDEIAIFLKEAEKYADILQLRMLWTDHTNTDVCRAAEASAYLKSKGVKIIIDVNVTPFKRLEQMDEIIANGKVDMVSPGHMFICNDNLGVLIQEGRGEDANPCIECHCCRGTSSTGDWVSQCTINPRMGMEYRKPYIEQPVKRKKRVAVIGGGPGGMFLAKELADRGHTPVIFEATGELGGQIKMSNAAAFKWELKRYLEFLKGQVAKRNIEVRLNTPATPELIEAEGFDTVVSAVGAEPKMPDIPGVEHAKWNPVTTFGNEDQLGHRVVVIGGASSASEAAIYLAQTGHDVVQLSRRECIAYDLNPIRSVPYMNLLASHEGVLVRHRVKTTKIEPGKVTYLDEKGESHTVECDDIVASGGMVSKSALAASFAQSAPEFYIIGDAKLPKTMRDALKDAYVTANQI
jgi:thioredoxin reductase